MNDEAVEAEESSAELLGGARLRAVRRDNDISVQDIAKELHLDEVKVRALEENDFDLLGAPVFAKGHMRKYAELVGVPIEDVLDDYYQLNRSAGAPPVVGPKRKHPRDYSFLPALLAGMLVASVFAAGLYWWFTREPAVDLDEAVEPSSLAPFVADQPPAEPAVDEPVSNDTVDSVVTNDLSNTDLPVDELAENELTDIAAASEIPELGESVPTEESVAPEIPAEDIVASDVPQVDVSLTFSGDCWTEASDASGRRLFYDLGSPGRVVTLSGDAPLRIVLGDANNVRIQVEGRDYPIPASARSGRLARLTIARP